MTAVPAARLLIAPVANRVLPRHAQVLVDALARLLVPPARSNDSTGGWRLCTHLDPPKESGGIMPVVQFIPARKYAQAGLDADLPSLNGTTFRERFCQCQNQRRAFLAGQAPVVSRPGLLRPLHQ